MAIAGGAGPIRTYAQWSSVSDALHYKRYSLLVGRPVMSVKASKCAAPLHDLLIRIDALRQAAELAISEEKTEAKQVALLKRRLKRLSGTLRASEASATAARQGEATAQQSLAEALRSSRGKNPASCGARP